MSFSVIAHRGGTDRYPELTLDTARYSLMLGADYVEMDVRITADGVYVISHDADGRRLFGSSAAISSMTAREFTALRYRSDPDYHGLTLRELLDSGIAPILLHIKSGGANLPGILACIEDSRMAGQVVVGVESPGDIRTAREYGMRTLAFCPTPAAVGDSIAAGADIIRLWENWVTADAIMEIRTTGRPVWIMAGSSEGVGHTADENLLRWRDMGAGGVLINEVARAKRVLG